jgi:phage terminase large subunit
LSSFILKKKYASLFTKNNRYYVVTGGRGSGKSYSINTFLLMLTYELNEIILFTRFTLTSAHVSIIPEFLDKIETANLSNDFYITKDEIVNKTTGSKILFKGIKTSSGNQTANLKSLAGITCFVLDEAEELVDEDIFDKIDFSIRSKIKQNRVILILNPATKESWIYQRFFEQKGVNEASNTTKGDVTYIHTTYEDNAVNLSESFLNQINYIKENQPNKYKHVILGGWLDKAEGVIYSNWKIGEYLQTDLSCYGQDFGFSIDPTTLIQVSIDNKQKRIYAKELLFKAGLTTSDIFVLNSKLVALNGLIVADSAEPRLISELKSKGLNIKGIEKPKITDRIALVQDYELIIEANSTNLIKELNNYSWHDKKSETPIDNFNHLLDALGYAVWDMVVKKKGVYGIF